MPEGTGIPRRDCAVIMARGRSVRMGYPKGSASLIPDGPSLLEMTLRLYGEQDWLRVIVTRPELLETYQALLESDPGIVWVAASGGGDTALTVRAAWDALAEKNPPPSHFWAHPVDLPLVKPETLAIIKNVSLQYPGLVARPVHHGQPGHPVVLPAVLLPELYSSPKEETLNLPMRDLLAPLATAGKLKEVPVADQGVVQDFDDPTALQHP